MLLPSLKRPGPCPGEPELASEVVEAGMPAPESVMSLWVAGAGYAVCVDFLYDRPVRRWSDERKAAMANAVEKATPVFTPEQEARIGEIAKDYLLAHPEVLVEVSQKLQAQQQEKQQQAMTAAVIQHQAALLNDKGTPSYGPADAKVTVVEFFDYQCIYCARLAPELEKVMKANPGVRFVFKELPIFGTRWPASLMAAKTGLQIYQQKGSEAYLQYHNAVYATGHNEGKLTDADITAAAKAVKLDVKTAPDVQGTLEGIGALAQQLGLTVGILIVSALFFSRLLKRDHRMWTFVVVTLVLMEELALSLWLLPGDVQIVSPHFMGSMQ